MTTAIAIDELPVGHPIAAGHGTGPTGPRPVPGTVAAELADEALRLLRARRGGLEAPVDPSATPTDDARRLRIAAIVRDLAPIRTRASLSSSYEREAVRDADVLRAYALRWIELSRGLPEATVRRGRAARVVRPLLRSRRGR